MSEKFDIVLQTRLDKSAESIAQLNEDVKFLDRRVGKAVKDGITLTARLAKDNNTVEQLKKNIVTLNNSLKSTKINLGVQLDKGSLDKLKEQIKQMKLDVNVSPKIDKSKPEASAPDVVKHETKQSPSMTKSNFDFEEARLKDSMRTKYTFDDDGVWKKQIDTINIGLKQTARLIQAINADGSISMTTERDINDLKAQNDLYRERQRIQKDISTFEKQMSKEDNGESIEQIQRKIDMKEQELKANRDDMKEYGLVSSSRDDELASIQKIYEIDGNIADINREKKESIDEQTKLYREQEQIQNKINSIDDDSVKVKDDDSMLKMEQKREMYEADMASNKKAIEDGNHRNQQRDEELAKAQKLREIEQDLADISSREANKAKEQKATYDELNRLENERYQLQKSLDVATDKDIQKEVAELQQSLEVNKADLDIARDKVEQRKLENLEDEKLLQKSKDKHESNLRIAEVRRKDRENDNLQKQQYDKLMVAQQNMHKIDIEMAKDKSDEHMKRLQEQKEIQQFRANEAKQAIGMNQVQDPTQERKIERLKEERALELEIAQIKDKESKSGKVYSELNKSVAEEFRIKKEMVGLNDRLNASARERLATNKSTQEMLTAQLHDGGLHNKEKENELLRERDRLYAELIAKEAKLDEKERIRVERLGEKQDAPKLKEMEFGDQQGIKDYVQQLYGANSEITKFQQKIDGSGKKMYQMDVVMETSANKIKTHKVAVDENTQSMYKMSESIKPNVNRMMSFIDQMGEAIKKSAIWAISMGALYGSMRQLKNGVSIVTELDKDLTQVAIGTRQAREEVQGYAEDWADLGLEMGKTIDEISKATVELVRQGLTIEESQNRLETILKLSAVGNVDTQETMRIITSSVNALGTTAEVAGDVLVKASQITASSVEEIGDALTRVASSAQATGTDIEQLGAVISVLTEVTQESPQSLGNSLKTLMARFSKINELTGETNEEFNDVQKAFESVGVAFTDGEGQIRPFYDLLEDLSGKWEDLDKNTKSYISTMAAGKHMCPVA